MVEWRNRRRSGNIEDRRGQRFSRGGGGLALLPLIFRIFGFRGLVFVVLIVGGVWLFGGDLQPVLNLLTGGGGQTVASQGEVPPGQEEEAEFSAVILADTEDVWNQVFLEQGMDYPEPALVLFSDAVPSGCGFASAAVGPFYCPPDRKIFIDLTFFDELSGQLGASGDFAPAYVIAHEVGHHVQNVTGVLDRANAMKQRLSQTEANTVQVRVELQADCYAGVWAARADRMNGILEQGDIQEGLRAAAAVGDDTLQRRAQGRVTPDSFTHGSAEQRQRWFMAGYDSGAMDSCDTFAAERL
ncbi:neutral zinc metallopeptidase [Euryhalocaulis sp.]|uniref:KPN_02809 family neutral zinc metallopeptidase n=1 Tax=Euryhalocaulis sp. TaxID=2744307 RepID=UPI00257961F8|nr:neutral zinc metallopeptidase [Euryhalocaulis sp.]